ncbi:MAG: hypothetical protein IID33_15880, partial [Planctomycetes bacterium]|nr:hypothetical protein [Planctomycetota bacterium]
LSSSPDGQILEYDFHLDVFPAGKLSGNVYASELDDRIPRPFLPSLDRRRERWGAGLFFNDPKLPMQLTWERVFDELRSGANSLYDDEDRLDETLRYEATWQPTEYHSLRMEYEYERRREKFSGTGTRFDTTRNYVVVNHVLQFGRDHLSRLETLARFQDETGDLARDTYEIAPQLRLQWTDKLSTTFRAQYLKETFADLSVRTWRGDAVITHQLDWLTSTADIYALRQNSDDDADSTEWGGSAGMFFNRENKLGRLSANLTYTHTATRTSDGRRSGLALSESLTFRDPQLSYLAQADVERGAIVVTSSDRSRVYLPGIDYVVVRIGRYTALTRVRNGRIADRETVLVSYTYRAADSFELSRDRLDFRVQQDFKFGLTPYYAGSIQEEDIAGDRFLSFRERNVNRHRIGATYRRPRWSLGLEYEFNDDSIDPYEALHVNGDVVMLEKVQHSLSGQMSMSRFLFDGSRDLQRRNTTLVDVGMAYRYLLGDRFEADAAGAFRWEDDSLFGRTKGVDLSASLSYRFGFLSALFEVEYDYLDLPDSSDNTVAFWFKLKREIPVITSRRR